MLAIAVVACDAPKEKTADAYFTPLFEDRSVKVAANEPAEQILELRPALCYRIHGTTSADPLTLTVIDDTGAPVRTTTSDKGQFEIGKTHGFCTRVIKGPYYLRLSSKADVDVSYSLAQSQSSGI